MVAARSEPAPAKINLTLRVIGRRPDGYHDLESLVVFAGLGDILTFTPGHALALKVRGPTAAASGEVADNLVLKAARALAEQVEGLTLGSFVLAKWLPVAAGMGGGSADAAAALRLLARRNRIALDDPRLLAAARATGADVPVCLDPRPRLMRGIGDVLSGPLDLPVLPAVLVNPGVAVPTKDVFAALLIALSSPSRPAGEGRGGGSGGSAQASRLSPGRTTATPDPSPQGGGEKRPSPSPQGEGARAALIAQLALDRNDLEAPAISLQSVIAEVLGALRAVPACRLARMSGSGATCFGLFASARAAAAAARTLRSAHPSWWVRPTLLAG